MSVKTDWLRSVSSVSVCVLYSNAFYIFCFNICVLSVVPLFSLNQFGTHQLFFCILCLLLILNSTLYIQLKGVIPL